MKKRLVVTGFEPGQKIAAIKGIRNASLLGLKEAKDFVEGRLPAVLLSDKTEEEVAQARGYLAQAGVRYVIEDDAPFQPYTFSVGDEVEVIDEFNGHNSHVADAIVTVVSKAYITVQTKGGTTSRFRVKDNRQVGYVFPQLMQAIRPIKSPESDSIESDEQRAQSSPVFTEYQFLAHLAELTGLYIESAKDDDPEWLSHLGSLEGGAIDFAMFVQALQGEVKEPAPGVKTLVDTLTDAVHQMFKDHVCGQAIPQPKIIRAVLEESLLKNNS